MSYEYTVRFHTTGNDHDGYCSGVEADTDGNTVNEYKIKKIMKDRLVTSIDTFDIYEPGCTSGGSGYCKGFNQYYEAIRILFISIYNAPITCRMEANEEPVILVRFKKLICLFVVQNKFLNSRLMHPVLLNIIFKYMTITAYKLYKNMLDLNSQKCCRCGLKK